MAESSGGGRTDTASRIIRASPARIYRAFTEPAALVSWLPPAGMSAELLSFEAREGGGYRMVLRYETAHATPGKSSAEADIVTVRFLELVQDWRIVQHVTFEAEDPAFAGAMTLTWSLAPVPDGTEVTILCENVPAAIRQEDHDAGLKSTLANLAAFAE